MKTHDSIILITGHGDRNTKIKLKVKWFVEIERNTPGMLIADIKK
jgi:hypothetical protein